MSDKTTNIITNILGILLFAFSGLLTYQKSISFSESLGLFSFGIALIVFKNAKIRSMLDFVIKSKVK